MKDNRVNTSHLAEKLLEIEEINLRLQPSPPIYKDIINFSYLENARIK